MIWLRRRLLHVVLAWSGWDFAGYGYGWPVCCDGRWYFHIERVWIRPKYRGTPGRPLMQQMLRSVWRWVDNARLEGAITRIKEDRPGVLHVGQRWAGYVPYKTEGGFVWCSVTRRS